MSLALFSIPVIFSATNLLGQIVVVPREPSIKTYPCSECHRSYSRGFIQPYVYAIRHPKLKTKHMEEVDRCDLCHSSRQPNKLNLLDGELIAYNDSHRLCAQCHGTKTYDWEAGLHGKMLGGWNRQRQNLSCSECHDPHSPQFKSMDASPAPPVPRFRIEHKEHDHHD